eukprot:30733-Pelagococcus_subviridis.AAC.5
MGTSVTRTHLRRVQHPRAREQRFTGDDVVLERVPTRFAGQRARVEPRGVVHFVGHRDRRERERRRRRDPRATAVRRPRRAIAIVSSARRPDDDADVRVRALERERAHAAADDSIAAGVGAHRQRRGRPRGRDDDPAAAAAAAHARDDVRVHHSERPSEPGGLSFARVRAQDDEPERARGGLRVPGPRLAGLETQRRRRRRRGHWFPYDRVGAVNADP